MASDIEAEVLEEAHAEEGGEDEFGEEEADDSERAVASSMIAAWGYDRSAEQIQITFNSGQTASYACSPETWEDAKNAISPGKFVHENFL